MHASLQAIFLKCRPMTAPFGGRGFEYDMSSSSSRNHPSAKGGQSAMDPKVKPWSNRKRWARAEGLNETVVCISATYDSGCM